jgi:hypothetical protein
MRQPNEQLLLSQSGNDYYGLSVPNHVKNKEWHLNIPVYSLSFKEKPFSEYKPTGAICFQEKGQVFFLFPSFNANDMFPEELKRKNIWSELSSNNNS